MVDLSDRDLGMGTPGARDRAEVPLMRVEGVVKSFAGAAALQGVDLVVERGSVHALVGENGAGKSTLGRIIAGVIRPDAGRMYVDGAAVEFGSPRDALDSGISIISQEISLVPQLSVVDNIFLGVEQGRGGFISERALRRRLDSLLESVGFTVRHDAIVGTMSTGEQQLVEILRSIARDSRLIVMDEPTAALSSTEVDNLHHVVRQLASSGTAVVYVSHFLSEILDISDRVTIMRNGTVVRTASTTDETEQTLVSGMLGRTFDAVFPERHVPDADAPVVLEADRLCTRALRDFSMQVRAGEIVGLAGLMGSGRSEALRALFGADELTSGVLRVDGRQVAFASPRQAIRLGIGMVPESRKDQGLVMGMSPPLNVTLPHLASVSRGTVIRGAEESKQTSELLSGLDVRGRVDGPVEAMSGGNQQKVLFGKWLFKRPRVMLIDEPTRGVDIGAKLEIYQLMKKLAGEGVAIVMVSSDLEEVLGMANVIHVMRKGTIVASFASQDATEHAIMRAAFGLGTDTDEAA